MVIVGSFQLKTFWSILPLVLWAILVIEKYITYSVNHSNNEGIYVAYLACLFDTEYL